MLNKKLGLFALLAGVAASEVMAGNLTSFATGDVLLCFRNGGTFDLVVDAGPIATLTNLTANTRYTISTYTGSQLSHVSTNSLDWSAFAWLGNDTLFVTKPRTSANTQSSPWLDKSSANQSLTIQEMATIPPGTVDEATFSAASTATAVIEEDISASNPNYVTGQSYHDALFGAYGGQFDGTFQGNPENTTLNTFTKSGAVERSDFYQLTPTGGYGLGAFIGYFELNTNGVMTYVAYPSQTPVIKSISYAGGTATINYTSGLYGTYTLRGTNNLAAAPLTWPAITTLSSGDTAVHSVTDTSTNSIKFYTITAQ